MISNITINFCAISLFQCTLSSIIAHLFMHDFQTPFYNFFSFAQLFTGYFCPHTFRTFFQYTLAPIAPKKFPVYQKLTLFFKNKKKLRAMSYKRKSFNVMCNDLGLSLLLAKDIRNSMQMLAIFVRFCKFSCYLLALSLLGDGNEVLTLSI